MNYLDYFNSVSVYALMIPGAVMCLLPVKNHLRIPAKKLCFLLFPMLILYSFLMPFAENIIPAKDSIPFTDSNTIFSLSAIIYFFFYCMAVDYEKIKLFYLTLSVMALFSFSGLTYYMVFAYVITNDIDTPVYDIATCFQWGMVFLLMGFVFFPFLNRKLTWILEHFHSKLVWNIVWTVPALITFCNYAMIPMDDKNVTVGRVFSLYLLLDSTLLLLFLLFQQMFYLIAKTLIEYNEKEKKTQLLQIQASQYQSLLRYVNETSKLRHDFRHTVHTLFSLAQERNTDKILCDLEEFSQNLESYHPHFICNHSTANAILAYYANIAVSQEIQTNWHVDLPEKFLISDVDLCSILGNLLENAIAGCMDVPHTKRFINLSADLNQNRELYIICVNSFNGNPRKSGTKYLSTKKDGSGIGLLSISATAEKYAGMARFYHLEGEFYSEIMLNLPSAAPSADLS